MFFWELEKGLFSCEGVPVCAKKTSVVVESIFVHLGFSQDPLNQKPSAFFSKPSKSVLLLFGWGQVQFSKVC